MAYRTYRKRRTLLGKVYIQTGMIEYGKQTVWTDVLDHEGKVKTFENGYLADLYIARMVAEDADTEQPPYDGF